jgi:predicted esterase
MSQKNNITVNKTATYYSLGNIKSAKTVWFVLHGYGYLAKDFINSFIPILTDTILVVAPEGFSKFYVKGVDGKIGASWMTKENREEEIADYTNYLNQLYATILKQVETPNVKINIVGFSQGGATASRWISNGKIKCDNFILWSSVFPSDMDLGIIKKVNTFFLYGDDDKYVTEERIKQQKAFLHPCNPTSATLSTGSQGDNITIKTILFEGKHEIPAPILVEQTKLNGWE